ILGDLSSLASNPQLRRLDLSAHLGRPQRPCKQSGAAALALSDTQIWGGLSSLANNRQLRRLDLSSTQMVSDLSSFANNPEQRLDLSSTQILSDLSTSRTIPSGGWTSATRRSLMTSAAWQTVLTAVAGTQQHTHLE
ncbi:unnamed protein product, partial [Effrenium voratum]